MKRRARTSPRLEALEPRALMAARLTGDVLADFPIGPGVVALGDTGAARHPTLPPDLAPLIKVSGFDISGLRLRYSPEDDILSVGIVQPDDQKTGRPVIAGDADNNGNGATVDPAVLALRPSFIDYFGLGGSETLGVFLDLNGDDRPDVVAGIPGDPSSGKLYQVADAVTNPDPTIAANIAPGFGSARQSNTGASVLLNDPNRPGFAFQITNFSKLYREKTGFTLGPDSPIRAGAFGSSNDDDGISEAFFPAQAFRLPIPPESAIPAQAADDSYGTDNFALLTVSGPLGVLRNDEAGSRVISADDPSALGARAYIDLDGALQYDPTSSPALRALAPGASVVDTLRYTIRNRGGGVGTATVRVVVSGVRAATRTSLVTTPVGGTGGVALAASVEVAPGLPAPSGEVAFLEGTTVLGVATLDASGRASFTPTNLAPGAHAIVAVYRGSAAYVGSTSAPAPVAGVAGATVADATRSSRGVAIRFAASVDPRAAALASNYRLIGRFGRGGRRKVEASGASYDAATRTVTLQFPSKLAPRGRYRLEIAGAVGGNPSAGPVVASLGPQARGKG